MGELGADLAAIDFFQESVNVTKLHAAIAGARQASREVFLLHVRFSQAQIIQLQDAWDPTLLQFQRVQIGDLMSP